ncbi:DUF1542 domain-containing protein [Weissella sagaensis]|uniref:DUF1542 domain-containing protein n=1 Tax=Weissella sagaensis TaxID=2559928 RepID=A0ABW1RS33_9LACO|nr:DUF1542 domain-containing protein [Weissella sagaensis]
MDLLQTATENVINDINNIDGLTSTQISDYESQINKVHDDAILEIGQTLSPEDALTAEQNGEISFTNIKNTAQVQAAKNDAVNAIDTAATNAIAAIENNTSLTAGQKDAYKEQITNAATDAKNDINQATNVADVTTAEDAGTANISAVSDAADLQAAKNDGIAKLDEAKNTTIVQITESGLSADRQNALINAVNEAYDTAVDKVTADTTIVQVNQDTTDGVNAINVAAEAAKNDINNNASLTADEKHDLVAAVDAAANTAKDQITQATSPDEATEATQTGEANIAVVSDAAKLQAAKNDAVAAIDTAATNAIAAIENNTSLTAGQKDAYKEQITNAATDAKNDINQATNVADVTTAEDAGTANISAVSDAAKLQAAKNDAANAIDTAATNAIAAIENNTSLTAGQKDAYKEQITNAATDAKNDINQATNVADVTTAEDAGTANISAVSDAADLQAAKNDGITKLDEAKNTTIAQITESGLSADRQNALINAVNEAYDTAVDKVMADTTIVQVNQDTTDGVNAINGIAGTVTEESETLQAAQETAQNAINAAAEAAKNDINNNASLTVDEKHDLVAAVDEAANTAKDQIAQATSPDEATEATQTGEANIAVVSDAAKLQAAKNEGIAKLDEAKNTTIAQITESGLSADRQNALINAVNEAYDTAVDKVTADTTIVQVNQDTTDGVNAINGIAGTVTEESEALQAAQETAQNAINAAAEAAKNDINNNASLTADEKHDLVAAVDEAANTAKDQIAQATSPDEATEATQTGEANIAVVSDAAELQAAKNEGIAKLDEAKNTTIAQITESGLSADRQNALINAVNEAYDTAVDKVTADTTIVQVNQDTTDGVNAINSIAGTVTEESEALQTAQNVAKDKINQIAQAAIKEINQNSNLTSKEKQRFIDGILQVVTDFNSHITNTTSSQEVALAEKDSEIAINNISGAAKLQAAKNVSINKLDKAKATVIDKVYHSGLSINRQNELINKIKQVYNDAVGKVKNDKTINSVEHDTIVGLNAINSILSEISKEMASLHDVLLCQ